MDKKEFLTEEEVAKLVASSKRANELNEAEMGWFTIRDYDVFNYDDLNSEDSFHPNGNTSCICLEDDYFLGIRCNHLILIDGRLDGGFQPCILILGNHKGYNSIRLIEYQLFEEFSEDDLMKKIGW